MADDDKPAKPAEPSPRIEAPMIFVKGGTTSASHDLLMQKQRADTDQRRAILDRQYQITRQDPMGARMHSMKLGGPDCAKIVLAIKHPKDNLILDWIECELTDQGEPGAPDYVLIIKCPHCVAKNPGHTENISVRQSNRKWYYDEKPPKWMRDMGSDRIWVNPVDGSTVIVAGSVTTDGWIPCGGLGCPWIFRIDDSMVYSK